MLKILRTRPINFWHFYPKCKLTTETIQLEVLACNLTVDSWFHLIKLYLIFLIFYINHMAFENLGLHYIEHTIFMLIFLLQYCYIRELRKSLKVLLSNLKLYVLYILYLLCIFFPYIMLVKQQMKY